MNDAAELAIITPNKMLLALCQFAVEKLNLKASFHDELVIPVLAHADAALIDADVFSDYGPALSSASASIPCVALTQTSTPQQRWHWLQQGYRDYLLFPFSAEELGCKLKSLPDFKAKNSIHMGHWTFDAEEHELHSSHGNSVRLSPNEHALLDVLADAAGRVCSVENLMNGMQAKGFSCHPNTIPVVVSKLRKTIETNPSHPCYLLTVKGRGYQLVCSKEP